MTLTAVTSKMATNLTKNIPRYSLYSTDSEGDQLTATHRRFDRCAALLKSIADSGKSRGGQQRKNVEKQPAKPSKTARGRSSHTKLGVGTRKALQSPDATSTPVGKGQKTQMKDSGIISCKTARVNEKTNRRRVTAHRRLKSEPAVKEASSKHQSEMHPALRSHRTRSNSDVDKGSNNHIQSFTTVPSEPTASGSRRIPLQQPDTNPYTTAPTSTSIPTNYSIFNGIHGSLFPQNGPPHAPMYPSWPYLPPFFLPPHNPSLSHANPLNSHGVYHPEVTHPPGSAPRWSSQVAPVTSSQQEYSLTSVHNGHPNSEERGSLGDLNKLTVTELMDKLGRILHRMSGTPPGRDGRIQAALAVHKALEHRLQASFEEGDSSGAYTPQAAAEYLAKLQTLQMDNSSLRDKLTQAELATKKTESENSKLNEKCLSLQQQLKAMDRDLEHLKFREEEARETDTIMVQLRTQLEMTQSDVRMSRMALAEKEGELTRAHDESLALRHCIAGFLTEATRQGNTAEVGWKVPLSLLQKLQEVADCGDAQRFLDMLEERTESNDISDSSQEATIVDDNLSLQDAQHLEGLLEDKRSSTTLSDLINSGLKDMSNLYTASRKANDQQNTCQFAFFPREDVSFMSEATTQTTSSERQFRSELAALDAEIARLQLQFQTAASAN